jgi:hypothetical protein
VCGEVDGDNGTYVNPHQLNRGDLYGGAPPQNAQHNYLYYYLVRGLDIQQQWGDHADCLLTTDVPLHQ